MNIVKPLNDFGADLAGTDEVIHIAYVGVDGFTQKGKPRFRRLNQILPQIFRDKKITDVSNDNADNGNQGNRT